MLHQEQTEFYHWIKDDYVKINENNILPGLKFAFDIEVGSYTFDVPYDGGSVMHYESKAFGINVGGVIQTTIEPLVCTIKNIFFEIF